MCQGAIVLIQLHNTKIGFGSSVVLLHCGSLASLLISMLGLTQFDLLMFIVSLSISH